MLTKFKYYLLRLIVIAALLAAAIAIPINLEASGYLNIQPLFSSAVFSQILVVAYWIGFCSIVVVLYGVPLYIIIIAIQKIIAYRKQRSL